VQSTGAFFSWINTLSGFKGIDQFEKKISSFGAVGLDKVESSQFRAKLESIIINATRNLINLLN